MPVRSDLLIAQPVRQASYAPVATVAVDSTGDGRANYMYTGVDRNRDGIPDAMQTPYVSQPVHTATVAVDLTGDGRANYLYTGVDRNYDGVPDSLQSLHSIPEGPMNLSAGTGHSGGGSVTVAVDCNDGRATYLVDRNNDGIADSLQVSELSSPNDIATVAVDATGDGRADYVYSGVDRNHDGIPDALEGPRLVYRP